MDKALISALIAGLISILTLAITNIISIFENRKNRNLSTVTKITIENMEANRNDASKILSLTHPAIITDLKKADIEAVKKELIAACCDLEMRMKTIFAAEIEIINAMRSLVESFLSCCKHLDNQTVEKLIEGHALFSELISVYDYTDWRYIKSQAQGKKRTSKNFESIYREQRELFNQSEKAKKWNNVL